MFSNPYRYIFVLLLATYSLLNTWAAEVFIHYPIVINHWELFLVFLVLTYGIWEGNRLLNNYMQTKEYKKIWIQLITTFGCSIIINTIITVIVGMLAAYFILPLQWSILLLPMKLLLMFAFRLNLFLNTLNITYWYINQLDKTQVEAEKLKKISTQAQLQAVKNQINPHFLFNNLSVLSALIPVDTTASMEFVKQFSKVYRYVLQHHEKEIIELSTELDFIISYLYLLKQRFGESLQIHIDVPENLKTNYIIPLALQMLVENAIKHNIVSKNKPLQISIFTENNNSLVIQNNLQRKIVNEKESMQLGLLNIIQRYEFLGQSAIIIQEDSHFFSVRLPILKIKNETHKMSNKNGTLHSPDKVNQENAIFSTTNTEAV